MKESPQPFITFEIQRNDGPSGVMVQARHEINDQYRELGVSLFEAGPEAKMLADIFITVDPDTKEAVVYISLDGQPDEHVLAIYPMRSRENAVKEM